MSVFSTPIGIAETLLANLPVGILVYEGDTGNCVLAGQAVADLLGVSVESLRQENFQTFASRCRLAESALHDRSSGHHEAILQTAFNKIITLDIFISWFDFEGKPHVLCTVSDISESKRMQAKLEKERALLRCLIDSAGDLIFIKDQASVYRACNKASEAFIGMPESEQIGKTDYDFFDREKAEEIRKADRQVLDQGKPVHIEEWVTGSDGRRLLMDTVKSPYYDPDGKPLGIVGIGRDLTERNRLEQDRLAHLRFFENMDRVNRAIQGADDPEKMMKDLLDAVLSIFDCDRAFLLYPCDPDAPSWSIPMERTKPEYPGAGVLGIDIPMDPEVSAALRVVLESEAPVKFDPETKIPMPAKVSKSFGMQSFIAMSFHPVNSKPWEFGLHQCSHARVWTIEEERLFQEIGRRLADGLGAMLAQRNLRRSLEKLEQAARTAHVGYWERDYVAETISLSKGACRIFGLVWPCRFSNLSEWHEQWLKLIHPEDRHGTAQAAGAALAGGPPYNVSYRVVRPDGEVRDVHSYAEVTRDAAGKPLSMFGTMIDITERKRDEERLRTSEKRLRLTLETTQIGIFDWDVENDQWYASPEYYTMLGYAPKEGLGGRKEWLARVHPDDLAHVEAKIQEVLVNKPSADQSHTYEYEARLRHADGTYRWEHVKGFGIQYDPQGGVTRILGIRMDITGRKTAEEALRRLNLELDQRVLDRTAQLEAANREMHAFTYTVSHDLRAPLRHIDGFLELLQQKAGAVLDEQSRHYMGAISSAAQRMGMLIDDLLSFSRMGRHAMSFREMALEPLVRDVIRKFEPDTAGREIIWRIGDLPAVSGDAAMLRMVFSNLISNALKFTRPRQQARIEIGALPGQGAGATIFVRDNGVGFDMAYGDKLFGVFQRLHRFEEFEGTGIGLANVRRIIVRHGGRTWAEGKPNQGATFYFMLPRSMTLKG